MHVYCCVQEKYRSGMETMCSMGDGSRRGSLGTVAASQAAAIAAVAAGSEDMEEDEEVVSD
jgi:hypothetical protein